MKLHHIMVRFIATVLIFGTLLTVGCVQVTTRRLTLTNFTSGEVLSGVANLITKEVTVTMPNGEVLRGKYSTAQYNSSGTGGTASAILKSDTSKLMLDLKLSFNEHGNGFGDAESNDGKKYKVQF